MGIIIGSAASKRLPHYAKVVNNTILTGARRRDGYAGSIRMSSKYGSVLRWKRPIVANNVIALLRAAQHICSARSCSPATSSSRDTVLVVRPYRAGGARRQRSAAQRSSVVDGATASTRPRTT